MTKQNTRFRVTDFERFLWVLMEYTQPATDLQIMGSYRLTYPDMVTSLGTTDRYLSRLKDFDLAISHCYDKPSIGINDHYEITMKGKGYARMCWDAWAEGAFREVGKVRISTEMHPFFYDSRHVKDLTIVNGLILEETLQSKDER